MYEAAVVPWAFVDKLIIKESEVILKSWISKLLLYFIKQLSGLLLGAFGWYFIFYGVRKPSQNGLIERLNKTLRVECLNLHWFNNLKKLNESIQPWSVDYNNERPHKNLNRLTPAEKSFYNRKYSTYPEYETNYR